ncbi:MAG TPA: TIGR03118 family protein [Tepidisphaeraceae bacterium]|nr:TIGR03118 family protein [Tepidisphaeraceae bacterium]
MTYSGSKAGRALATVEPLERRQLLAAHGFVTQNNLLSDGFLSGVPADANLQNPWGVSFFPGGPLWVSDNATGMTTFYDGTGAKQGQVAIPGGGGANPSNPTGQAYAGGQMSFDGTPEQFVFVGEDGAISAWASGTTATLVHDNSPGAVYKGATIVQTGTGDELFAANFRAGTVEVYDQNFNAMSVPGGFADKRIPKGYAPFNVQNVNGQLYVTYAKQDAAKHDDVAGPGHGFVDVFDASGHLLHRLQHGSFLDSPWGVAVAPSTWGSFAGDILVGQFGNGRIDVFNSKGHFIDVLRNQVGKPLAIDGLWAVTPGSGLPTADPNAIFFTAGPNRKKDGLFGDLTFTVGTFKHPKHQSSGSTSTTTTTTSPGSPVGQTGGSTTGSTGQPGGSTGGTTVGNTGGSMGMPGYPINY